MNMCWTSFNGTGKKSKYKLEVNQSELDFIRMVLDFIIMILKAKLDFASIELESMKNMNWTTQLKRFLAGT
jgi:hypothetical protein